MKLKKTLSNLILLSLILLTGCSAESIQEENISLQNLHEGDLMFVVKEESNPITDATQGIDGLKIDHVAIFHHTDSTDYALEAISKGVVLTPLAKFLERTKGKEGKPLVAVGRVIADCDMSASMKRALNYLGRPYDHFICPMTRKYIAANWCRNRTSITVDTMYFQLSRCLFTMKTEKY